jgi:hypothetical protein
MNVYATVDEIKLWIGGNLSELEDDDLDPILKRYTVEASRTFDLWVSNGKRPYRRFYPTVATRYYDHPARTSANGSPKDSSVGLLTTKQPSASILRLNNDLLELTTLTTKNGALVITSADYLLYRTRFRDDLYDQTPYNAIKLEPNGTYTVFQYINTPNQANAVDGIWGYHDDWANAWEDSGDSVQNDPTIDASTTALKVNSADGDDINGLPNRFKHQQLIKVDSEYMWVTDITADNNILTVRRGMNGSTAAQHDKDDTIFIYRPPYDIQLAMKTLTLYLHRRRGAIGKAETGQVSASSRGRVLVVPPTLPQEVTMILEQYKK